MAIEVKDYSKESDEELAQTLHEMSSKEVQLFNADLDRMLHEISSPAARSALLKAENLIFRVTRVVMEKHNQRYGGSNAKGEDILASLIRPRDVGFTSTHTWDFTPGGTGVVDWIATAASPLAMNTEDEAQVHVGVLTNTGPDNAVESLRYSKLGTDMTAIPLNAHVLDPDQTVMQYPAAFVVLPAESYHTSARATANITQVLALLGIHITTGTKRKTNF